MSDPVTEIFGYILFAVALLLAIREQIEYSRRDTEKQMWLVTPRRYRRRMLVSVVLGIIGGLFVVHARQLIPLRVGTYVMFIFGLMSLSLILVLLVVIDVIDTARTAASSSMRDLQRAIEEEKKRQLLAKDEQP